MRHIFFSERQAAKIEGLPKTTPLRDINKVAIIGGGTMGGGIAMCFANVGIPVVMLEINDEALERGLGIKGLLVSPFKRDGWLLSRWISAST